MNNKTKVLLASVLVVGLVAVASAQTSLFKGSFSDLRKVKVTVSECSESVDKLAIRVNDEADFVSDVSSEVYSRISSQVPSIVWSEVETTRVPSIVSSWASSRNASRVVSEVEVDDKYVENCLTVEEKNQLLAESREKAVRDAKAAIKQANQKLKAFDSAIREVTSAAGSSFRR